MGGRYLSSEELRICVVDKCTAGCGAGSIWRTVQPLGKVEGAAAAAIATAVAVAATRVRGCTQGLEGAVGDNAYMKWRASVN